MDRLRQISRCADHRPADYHLPRSARAVLGRDIAPLRGDLSFLHHNRTGVWGPLIVVAVLVALLLASCASSYL